VLMLVHELRGCERMIERTEMMMSVSVEHLKELAIGGTAVGTGLNAHPEFSNRVCNVISKLTNKAFNSAPNKFHSLTSYDEIVYAHGALKALSADLMKIANDVRRLASGPRCAIS